MDDEPIPGAALGGPRTRTHVAGEKVRIELRVPEPLARRVYAAAHERGQSVSQVGVDALSAHFGDLT